MKKIISILLAIILVGMTTVTAFALDTDYDKELNEAKSTVLSRAYYYELHFIYYEQIVPMNFPIWSNSSSENLINVITYIRDNIDNCTTVEETEKFADMLYDAVQNMCVDPDELKWMLDYMEKDYESVGYYDDDTMTELKVIYEQAQQDYASNDESKMHKSYIALRNELNKLCLYNQIFGDVNFDGIFSIDDITLMQKFLADLETLNTSQRYVCRLYLDAGIDSVTIMQKELADISDHYRGEFNYYNTQLIELEPLDPNKKYMAFDYVTEDSNYLYRHDCYTYGRWFC